MISLYSRLPNFVILYADFAPVAAVLYAVTRDYPRREEYSWTHWVGATVVAVFYGMEGLDRVMNLWPIYSRFY